MNIAQGLAHAKKVYGNRQAVVCGDTRYTWIECSVASQKTIYLLFGIISINVPGVTTTY